ncbi:unnamed protein product [Fraxinus pennsylvanica]|uniref:DUF7950 domain-containing protein n=1 Tax=Fraxinus pennsylvanica TaxID=56036 RepID=A0AAD1YRM4_9LAMI|nr:unnamed protein product [Fraxinus pennsylvanica]
MNGRDGCCIARHDAGSVSAYNMSKMDRIMQRFRPIAPKPAAAIGSFSSGCGNKSAVPENAGLSVKVEIGKRPCEKYSASSVKKKCTGRKRKASSEDSELNGRTASNESISGDTAVTLLLLPETPDVKESSKREPQSSPLCLSFGNEEKHVGHDMEDLPLAVVPQAVLRQSVVGSWVKVECITVAWEHCDVYGLGHTDEERMMNLYLDTCPGFVSDGLNRVKWTNLAYKQMVQGDAAASAAEVWLVINKGVALPVGWPSFTCWLTVVKSPTTSLTVPCDVWRMECGGFAWRLDAKAALSLGS